LGWKWREKTPSPGPLMLLWGYEKKGYNFAKGGREWQTLEGRERSCTSEGGSVGPGNYREGKRVRGR